MTENRIKALFEQLLRAEDGVVLESLPRNCSTRSKCMLKNCDGKSIKNTLSQLLTLQDSVLTPSV